ncbi:transglycosylase domain-containing protein [Actinomadura hibisca]|uniref:transglycosylase domain-containing protein n=1 Tax=Actinomadura hibisca TaxID=68565 RepID=UPI0012FA9B41|nr:transglycosylase domain-containing protein [Actinomadura hibisca]
MVSMAYAGTPVPEEPSVEGVEDQASIFYYSDGKTEIGRMGKARESVELAKVPRHVQDAVLAAENRTFRTDKGGISVKGTGRAVWLNLTGGKGGGSTITQQLAKNYYSDPFNRTYGRKVKEMFISIKLEDKYDKEEILKLYLNTIYFGRDTYGIQAASREYFGKNVDQLNKSQAAVLGGMIQDPNREITKKESQPWLKERYAYTLNGMVGLNTITQAEADSLKTKLPSINKPGKRGQLYAGQRGYMLMRAKTELMRQGITEQELTTKGLRITTTFDEQKMRDAKQAAEHSVPQVHPKQLARKSKIRVGLISVRTENGEVEAFYGGPDYLTQAFDNVWSGSAQAGSAVKPYVLATALKQGYNLNSRLEGRSMAPIDGNGNVVSPNTPGVIKVPNGHTSGPTVTMTEATADSVNTAFVQLGFKVGHEALIKTETDAGISPDLVKPYKGQGGIALGINNIRPVEQAAGYQAFANGGTWHEPRVLRKVMVRDENNKDKKKTKLIPYRTPKFSGLKFKKERQVFSSAVAADATHAMRQVVLRGTAQAAALPDRPVAGKTGTTDHNVATWFVGYVPQLSTAVTLYNDEFDKVAKRKKSLILPGIGEVEGGSVPARIWRAYMVDATKGMEVKQFPPPANAGRIELWAKPPVKKEKKEEKKDENKDKPRYCRLPMFKDRPECKDGNEPEQPKPGGEKPPCQSPIANPTCDPNKPPQPNPPKNGWWCRMHPDYPACRKNGRDNQEQGQNEPVTPNSLPERSRIAFSPSRPRD